MFIAVVSRAVQSLSARNGPQEKKMGVLLPIVALLKAYQGIVALFFVASFVASAFEGISIGMLIPLLGSLIPNQSVAELSPIFQTLANLFADLGEQEKLLCAVGGVTGAILLKNTFLSLTEYIGAWLSARVMTDLRRKGVQTLLSVGMGFYNTAKIGDLSERMITNTQLVNQLIEVVVQFIGKFTFACVLLGVLFTLSVHLTLFAIGISVIVVLVMTVYVRYLKRIGERNAQLGIAVSSDIHETISGIQVIKAYNRETVREAELAAKIEEQGRIFRYHRFAHAFMAILTETFGIAAVGAIFVVAIVVFNFHVSSVLIQVVPFLYTLNRVIPMIQLLNRTRGVIATRAEHLRLVNEFLDPSTKPFVKAGTRKFRGLSNSITFEQVSFSYFKTQRLSLQGVSFQIPKGRATAFVGESGAGKSTIVNLLLRFYDPSDGEICVDGVPITHYTVDSFRAKISLVSQDTFIFHASVRDNIAIGFAGNVTDRQITEAAERAGAADFIAALPMGYDTLLGDRGVRLSGGQRQRLSIARAVLKDPEILILDEATSALDNVTERRVQESMAALQSGRTVITIAHRLSTIKSSDQIIVLKDGRVSEIGHEQDLRTRRDGEYHRLANLSA